MMLGLTTETLDSRLMALLAQLETLETHMSRMEWQRQRAEDDAVRQMMRTHVLEARAQIDTVEDTDSSSNDAMTPESIQAMIDRVIQTNSTHTQDDASHNSGGGLRRHVQPARVCSYTNFMKCQPLSFKGTECIVGLSQWLEKIESVFHISSYAIDKQVKFATCTLLGASLTWVRGNDVAAYTQRFQELALMCTKFLADETEKIDKYISGLPDNIHGNVMFARPKTLDDAIELANDLMDQKLRMKHFKNKSLEARIVVHEKNEAVYEEDIVFLNAKDKAGLGYDSQMNESEVVNSVFNGKESDVDDSPVNDRFKTDDSVYKAKDTDRDNDSVFRPKPDQTKPKFTKITFVKSDENVKYVNKENTHRQEEYLRKIVTKSGQVPVNAAKQSSPRAATLISTARPVNTTAPKSKVNDALPKTYSYFKAHSPVRRVFTQKLAAKTYNLNEKVKTARVNNVTTAGLKVVVNAAVGNGENVVKSLACWIWRPTGNVIDHTSKDSRSYIFKRFDYVDLQGRLKSLMA
ncbi:hypothetical protein Tco_1381474 [Tanacetum coccineum]